MIRSAILVSPDPVDGYPPVQHQARLLADAGYNVELLTVPLAWSVDGVRFKHPGVIVRPLMIRAGGAVATVQRAAAFVAAVVAARRRLWSSDVIEIAYEPAGILYSDLAPLRPKRRIAHFHECLQMFETAWIEKRVAKAIQDYQLVVVPGAERADIFQSKLRLAALPMNVPNYPLTEIPLARPECETSGYFEVVYCGSVGTHQKLDMIIESVRQWPDRTVFRIIGKSDSSIAEHLAARARDLGVADRVLFDGWVPYDELPSRLTTCTLGILLLDPSYEQFRTALSASNKRYQYMQAGLPQIGDMNPGVAKLLEGQGIGRCLTEFTHTQLAALVAEYEVDPARCRKEGARAYTFHCEKYNYQKAFQPVLDWIQSSDGIRQPQTLAVA